MTRLLPLYFLVVVGVLQILCIDVAAARGCRACAFAGLCQGDEGSVECGPSQAQCAPKKGVLLFNSLPPDPPAYWTLKLRVRRRTGRLVGKLDVFADDAPTTPRLPDFPVRCDGEVCFGRKARFSGEVDGDRFTLVARYRKGATCEFAGSFRFGLGEPDPNWFTCRDATGQLLSEGPFTIQGIRLTGCLG